MDPLCPDCGAVLGEGAGGSGRSLVCHSCHGRMVGLAPFERLVGTSLGAQVWRAAADGPAAANGSCPYCQRPMRVPSAGDNGGAAAAGIVVCRLCREVWLPAASADWMKQHRVAPEDGAGVEHPDECGNCGAPFHPDEEGRCPYCHTQIAAPTPLVMIVNQPAPSDGFRLF